MMVTIRPPPTQKLLDYVVANYSKLEGSCQHNQAMQVDANECSDCLQKSYFGGTPKYECINFRRVYLIRYLATQVAQTSDLIREHIVPGIQSTANLSALSLGGGPGVEALALMDQLYGQDGKHDVIFDNIDLEASWEPIYRDLLQRFAEWVKSVEITPGFYRIDVKSGITAGQYLVVSVPWILSEMNGQDRVGVLVNARNLAWSGGYVAITDRPERDLVDNVNALIGHVSGWTLVHHNPEWKQNCGLQFPPGSDVFKPKFECNTARWVLRKA